MDLKPMRKDTQSPKQERSVASQKGPWPKKKILKKKTPKKLKSNVHENEEWIHLLGIDGTEVVPIRTLNMVGFVQALLV